MQKRSAGFPSRKEADGKTNYASLNDSFQKFKSASGDKPKFYLVDTETTFSRGYRYAYNDKLVQNILNGTTGRSLVYDGDDWYRIFDKFDKSADAKNLLQLQKKSTQSISKLNVGYHV